MPTNLELSASAVSKYYNPWREAVSHTCDVIPNPSTSTPIPTPTLTLTPNSKLQPGERHLRRPCAVRDGRLGLLRLHGDDLRPHQHGILRALPPLLPLHCPLLPSYYPLLPLTTPYHSRTTHLLPPYYPRTTPFYLLAISLYLTTPYYPLITPLLSTYYPLTIPLLPTLLPVTIPLLTVPFTTRPR